MNATSVVLKITHTVTSAVTTLYTQATTISPLKWYYISAGYSITMSRYYFVLNDIVSIFGTMDLGMPSDYLNVTIKLALRTAFYKYLKVYRTYLNSSLIIQNNMAHNQPKLNYVAFSKTSVLYEPDLILYLPFDEDTGSTFFDFSQYSNQYVITNVSATVGFARAFLPMITAFSDLRNLVVCQGDLAYNKSMKSCVDTGVASTSNAPLYEKVTGFKINSTTSNAITIPPNMDMVQLESNFYIKFWILQIAAAQNGFKLYIFRNMTSNTNGMMLAFVYISAGSPSSINILN